MEFVPFYHDHVRAIRAELYAYTGDLRVATDLTREAFARTLKSWGQVQAGGNPLGWVRATAFELGTAHLAKAGPGPMVAGAGPMVAAGPAAQLLAQLPPFERRLVVLHHLGWLSALDIAMGDGVDEGRVRFWLEDARNHLAPVAQPYAVGGDPVAGLLAAVRDEADAAGPPEDVTAVSTVVSRRRTRRLAVIAAGVAVLVAVPVVALAASKGGGEKTAGTTPTTAGSRTTAPSPTQSPTPSPTPPPTPPGPEAKLTVADFAKAKVNLDYRQSGWSQCPFRDVTFRNGQALGAATSDPKRRLRADIRKLAYSDVDGDGKLETAALIVCWEPGTPDSGGSYEVTVFDKDAKGAVYTLATAVSDPAGGELTDLKAAPNGGLSVEFADYEKCCVKFPPQRQWRTFTYTGGTAKSFSQTGGPTTFGPNKYVTDIAIDATIKKNANSGGNSSSTATIVVKNNGQSTASWLYVAFVAPNAVKRGAGKGLTGCVTGPTVEDKNQWIHQCKMPMLAPGKSVTVSLTVTYRGTTLDLDVYAIQRLNGHYDQETLPEPFSSTGVSGLVDNYDTLELK